MRLKLHTDYALRTLLFLAAADRDDWIQGGDIASSFDISKGHVLKVIQRLSRLGYVKTKRGVGGGTKLAKDPTQIRLGVLISDLEEEDLLACVNQHESTCVLHNRCGLRVVLGRAQNDLFKTLDQYTLEDISVNSIG